MPVPLATYKSVTEFLSLYNITANKRYGQNFLTDPLVLNKVTDGARLEKTDTVLEIGPGLGCVTAVLIERAARVVAVEKDARLASALGETFKHADNLKIIQADILQTNISSIIKGRFKLVSNLPYNIAATAVMFLLESGLDIESLTVMVQKEVGARLMADKGSKNYGALTVMARYYADTELLANVPSNCFFPRPNVDSALLKLTPRWNVPDNSREEADKELLFAVIKAAFAHRRKTLVNCLCAGGFGIDKKQAEALLARIGFGANIRGETLGLDEFIRLSNEIKPRAL